MENNKNLASEVAGKVIDKAFSFWLFFQGIIMAGMSLVCLVCMFTTDTKTGMIVLGSSSVVSFLISMWAFKGSNKIDQA